MSANIPLNGTALTSNSSAASSGMKKTKRLGTVKKNGSKLTIQEKITRLQENKAAATKRISDIDAAIPKLQAAADAQAKAEADAQAAANAVAVDDVAVPATLPATVPTTGGKRTRTKRAKRSRKTRGRR